MNPSKGEDSAKLKMKKKEKPNLAKKVASEPMKATDKVSLVLLVLLEAAQGAGMTSERAEAIYEDIVDHYRNMREGFPEALVEELTKVVSLKIPSLGDFPGGV